MNSSTWIDELLSADGQALLLELHESPVTDATELSVITRLRQRYSAGLVAAALTQSKLRVRARSKFTHADRMYFTQAGLEQSSSERMAQHHAARYSPFDQVADLCTGIGGDLLGLVSGRTVVAVDKDPTHARLALLNADANGVGDRVTMICADVRDVRLDEMPAMFVDPARRSSDRRFAVGTSEPSLDWCFALAGRGVAMGIKAAPGLPTELVPAEWELEFVSEHRELKESVLWSPVLRTVTRRATLLPSGSTLVDQPGSSLPVGPPGAYLLDPDPAVTRAGLVEELGRTLGEVWKIDDRIAFLSADFEMQTPFGRTLAVEASMPWNLARLRETLRALNVGTVDIRKRGSAVDVDEVQKKLKLTGDRAATVVLTRVDDQPWMMVCSTPATADQGSASSPT